VLLLLVLLAALVSPGKASAAPGPITEQRAMRTADRDPNVVEEKQKNGELGSSASLVEGNWEVAYFAHGDEVALVIVDSRTDLVRESWTGYQVAWKIFQATW
jgi:hypothetical protein